MQKRIFISVLGSIYDDKCCINEMTFRELCETLKTPQILKQTEEEYNALPDDEKRQLKFGACFSACIRSEQGDEAQDIAYILALDVDHPNATLLDDIKARYPDLKVFAYTTFRSREDSPRYRIIIPLSRPVSKDEYAKLCEAFTEKLNCEFDKQCFNFRQKLQFPRVLKGIEYHFCEWGSESLDVDALLGCVTALDDSRPGSEYAKLSCRGKALSGAEEAGCEHGSGSTPRALVSLRLPPEALSRFKMIFGRDNVFAEVQYHGEESEREFYPLLADIADSLDIPLLATNDPYFANNTEKDRMKYSVMKFRSDDKYTEPSDAEKEHYIKTPDELKAALKSILTEEQCDRAIKGIELLASQCNLKCPSSIHYPKFKSDVSTPAPQFLSKTVYEKIPSLADVWNEVYEKRLCEELSVITELGFCDYLLIVADIVSFAKAEAKRICKYNSLPVGPGRGSTVGSLVCYLLGITDIDPVAHGLMFERFLNRARRTMPDIDIDLAPFVRERVLQYLRDKYGANAVCGIIEPVRYKAKEAITLAAKFTAAQTGDKDYLAAGEALSKACKSGSQLTDNTSELSSFDSDDKAKHIIETARLCDGMVKTLSKHPCGIVIGNTNDISEYIPVICDNDRELLADCDKSYIESFYGLLKIDLLSLRTLDAVSNMLANIEKNEKIKINFSDIPEEREVFSSVFHHGNTDFIFQFGSDGMKDWLRKLHPRNIDELTMLAAAFRPGPMQFLPVIKDVLYGEKQPELISPKLFDRQALSDLLLSTVKNKKCKVVYFLSGNGDLYTNTENLLVRNIGCAGRHILFY